MSLLRNLGRRAIFRIISSSTLPPAMVLAVSTSSPTYFHLNLQSQMSFISQHRPMEYSSNTSPTTERLPSSKDTLLISDACKKRLKEILDEESFLRISVEGGGCSGYQYKFEIDKTLEKEEDVILQFSEEDKDKTMIVIDKTSLNILKGSTVDYETELIRSAFRITNNPQAEHGCSCGSSFNVKID